MIFRIDTYGSRTAIISDEGTFLQVAREWREIG